MFVSSYSTYIDTDTTKKVQNRRDNSAKKLSESFSSKLLQTTNKDITTEKKLPVNYISNYKAFYNKQQLEHSELKQNPTKMKFSKISSMATAQLSYSDNSKLFSLLPKPKPALDQTPKLDRNLPIAAQEKQEDIIKRDMINTYISNENYYHITAA